ncbi:uncharacterized protein BO66DRAFT_196804 [Aspergillus aculeatinus CBS 121060]|uniref:Uncharacterized protein n=1 Tax=Aspergillus aculeatinus CBS 121060 TaxID=1448322 RepID=A0ACD1GX33_9EURO|nr:hypothetical protein BO66DRAFT_196804 [Aspergillus aculeatinus CBS 121060]RAH65764.1 hypothetical protein BO66DRAFT_196804 [Aspergillus aculeatinus CBS 121060]
MTRGWTMTLRASNRVTCRPALEVARLSATYAWPFSNTLPRSTLTRCRVWPCALWMDSAQARISGTCWRCACTSPLGSSIFHVSGWQSRCRSVPSGCTKHTSGHLRVVTAAPAPTAAAPPSLWASGLSFLRARANLALSSSSKLLSPSSPSGLLPPENSFSFSM